MLDRTFASEFLRTIDDPDSHGVHFLFNSYWKHMPEAVRQSYQRALHDRPEWHAWVEARFWPEPYSFDALGKLPRGTLGRDYYQHIVDNKLDRQIASGYRDFHQMLDASGALAGMPEDVKYAVLRGFQIHDLLHIVTGFDTTGLGEIALQAFCLAQIRFLYFATWMSVVTTRAAFLEPDAITPLMDAITKGWSLGRSVRQLQTVHWEAMLHLPVADIRREFGVPDHAMMKQAA